MHKKKKKFYPLPFTACVLCLSILFFTKIWITKINIIREVGHRLILKSVSYLFFRIYLNKSIIHLQGKEKTDRD